MTNPVVSHRTDRSAPAVSSVPPPRRARRLLGVRTTPGRLALWVFRIPLPLYRSGWGWLLGRVFVAVTHVGRKSGTRHLMTAMVLRYDPATEEVVIFSAWGPNTDWMRNLRARPAAKVQLGRREYVPVHRFLTDEEAYGVVAEFIDRHPHRVRVARRVLGWPDLHDEAMLREFVSTRPFVAFKPAC
jgi:deazaflavin-dependent oxidoreductase (nitroreductase family)